MKYQKLYPNYETENQKHYENEININYKIYLMKKLITTLFTAIFAIALVHAQNAAPAPEVYRVVKTKKPIKPDANWDKKEWKKVKSVTMTHYMGDVPDFKPEAQAKMVYDKDNLYVIFRVKDRYVKCVTDRINGPVYRDSAVEFFFSPDTEKPLHYFNYETNCGGTALMQFHVYNDGKRESTRIAAEDIALVEINPSLPKTVDPEITEDITWTIEYRIPLSLLRKHSAITTPAKGVEWRANFYKIAEITSNPHYITWSKVDQPRPNFHVPENFGRIIFK